jgi:hypothetical protein
MGWCESKSIELKLIQARSRGKIDYIEDYNRSYRHELLSANIFENLNQVKKINA